MGSVESTRRARRPNGRWQRLRAGISIGERTVKIFMAVHPERLKNNSPCAERQLLVRLRTLLPVGVTPLSVPIPYTRR